jgi:hypothetical protein
MPALLNRNETIFFGNAAETAAEAATQSSITATLLRAAPHRAAFRMVRKTYGTGKWE